MRMCQASGGVTPLKAFHTTKMIIKLVIFWTNLSGESFGPEPFDMSDAENAQINQNNTKVRMLASELDIPASGYIIFTKQ